ncbi:MAG: winged helix-turn-helix transcriptional regulator [Myxococcota bacterium]|nr:winged helix-turn-helix transcriptional regulator [Myxococcota bacterium]
MAEQVSVRRPGGDFLRPGQIFDPVARALDLIGDRWKLVIVRHLLGGPKGFQELRARTGIAPRVLSGRLRQLAAEDLVHTVARGSRSVYAVTDRGRTLEPIVASIARWWVRHAMEEHIDTVGPFTDTSAQSILESLPFLLREERARGARVSFEMRLTGEGGGVWTVSIHDGVCEVRRGFAESADVRYTAEARVWCAVALGLMDARTAHQNGLLSKDGGREALDEFFYQIPRPSSEATRPGDPARSHEGETQ